MRPNVEPIASIVSTPPDPIPWTTAVMRDRDNADQVTLQPVNQRIWKTVEGQRPRAAIASVTQLRKPVQEAKRPIEFIGEFISCNECVLAGIPIDSGIGIGLCLSAKTDPHRFWQQ